MVTRQQKMLPPLPIGLSNAVRWTRELSRRFMRLRSSALDEV
jgi:hypothetical protein